MAEIRETAILIDHDDGIVYLDSTERRWWTRAEKLGFTLDKDNGPGGHRHYVGRIDGLHLSLQKKRRVSERQRAALQKAREAAKVGA